MGGCEIMHVERGTARVHYAAVRHLLVGGNCLIINVEKMGHGGSGVF